MVWHLDSVTIDGARNVNLGTWSHVDFGSVFALLRSHDGPLFVEVVLGCGIDRELSIAECWQIGHSLTGVLNSRVHVVGPRGCVYDRVIVLDRV